MKRKIALGLAVLMMAVSCYTTISAAAEGTSDPATNSSQAITGKVGDLSTYAEYKAVQAKKGDFPASKQDIVIDAVNFISSKDATVEKFASYKDEQGTTKQGVIKWTGEKGTVTYEVTIPANAKYAIKFSYLGLKGRNNPISMGLMVDGAIPFDGVREFDLPRLWKDGGPIRKDGLGNEFSPEQVEVFAFQQYYAVDSTGLEQYPFDLYLTAGKHTITVQSVAEPVALDALTLTSPVSFSSYAEVKEGYSSYKNSTIAKPIIIEGEDAALKSTYSLVSKSDATDPSISSKTGSSPYLTRINYIGNTNWQLPGDKITWKFHVDQDGLYKLGFRFRQNMVLNGNSYRKLAIDDQVPFGEAANLKFSYGVNWQYMEWQDNNKNPYYIYLTAGDHNLSMEVALGELTELTRQLQDVMYDVGAIYRKIVMITGETPDANRDYDLFNQIPHLKEDLTKDKTELDRISHELENLAGKGKSGGTSATTIRALSAVLGNMLKFPLTAHRYKNMYYTNYCSVSALVYEMMKMGLSLDYISVAAPDYKQVDPKAGFIDKSVFSFRRFLASFSTDYNNLSGETTNGEKSISIWVNWGRDQVRVLNDIIQSSFTPKTGIHVNLKISNASYIQGILSGNAPDCLLNMPRSEPVNLALRGSMLDLSKFPDYKNVLTRFMTKDCTVPFQFEGGVYALPDTITYYMMFYRSDIFEEYGLAVPKTWDDFIKVASILQRNNLQTSLPYTQITQITQTNMGVGAFSIFPSMVLQKGGTIYNKNLSATDLTSAKAIDAFEFWTDFYNEYKYPVTADFFNRFRIGIMPLGIQSYGQYIGLSLAAPEINGKWKMVPIPGYKQADGTINNAQAGAGSGCGILKASKNPKGGWEFMKWWTSAETQLQYSNNCESILGVAGRVATSNVEAFKQMGWDNESLSGLLTQWSRLKEIPEVPGGYYTARVIDQAYWNVVNNGQNSKDMLIKWAEIANKEIARKRAQYNVQ